MSANIHTTSVQTSTKQSPRTNGSPPKIIGLPADVSDNNSQITDYSYTVDELRNRKSAAQSQQSWNQQRQHAHRKLDQKKNDAIKAKQQSINAINKSSGGFFSFLKCLGCQGTQQQAEEESRGLRTISNEDNNFRGAIRRQGSPRQIQDSQVGSNRSPP